MAKTKRTEPDGGASVVASGDPSALVAAAIEDLYRVFAGYRLRPHVEACSHCVSEHDHALIYARPLRALTTDDLDRYAFKAMTTWGDENDFRHFLPRILELRVRSDTDGPGSTEVVLKKLAYANWTTWPKPEQAALRSFLRLRWSLGLTQVAVSRSRPDSSDFDADSWLCGVAAAGEDIAPYVDAWRRKGATATLGHVVSFLEANPDLLTEGRLGNGFWNPENPQTAACAKEMRAWLTALVDDPEFQAQLAAWYQT